MRLALRIAPVFLLLSPVHSVLPEPPGGMGGWFPFAGNGDSMKDYLTAILASSSLRELRPHAAALLKGGSPGSFIDMVVLLVTLIGLSCDLATLLQHRENGPAVVQAEFRDDTLVVSGSVSLSSLRGSPSLVLSNVTVVSGEESILSRELITVPAYVPAQDEDDLTDYIMLAADNLQRIAAAYLLITSAMRELSGDNQGDDVSED